MSQQLACPVRSALLALALLVAGVRPAPATTGSAARHPMHTAVAEVTYDAGSGLATIRIRVFADDFAAAVPLPGGAPAADSAMAYYVRGTFTLTDRAGRPAPLRWEGAERTGDVILLTLRAPAPEGLTGARIGSSLLCERFEDQVNIVRASYAGRTVTLLFTRGDAAKPLP